VTLGRAACLADRLGIEGAVEHLLVGSGLGYVNTSRSMKTREQAGPKQQVRDVALAEQAGFDFAVISDHYFPWLDTQGHSPNTRVAVRVHDWVPGTDGNDLYNNRAVLFVNSAWGKIRSQEDCEDTERASAFAAGLDQREARRVSG
jgi:hypothetical protein